ncbi:MAG TPA: hypothetical protein VFX43_00900 [Chitinophagaceae bacterium]|nr:hypothetical protein [Chitinophagaceae bacterium]
MAAHAVNQLSIPKDWKRASASLKKKWYLQYYFHDPNFIEQYPRGKFCQVKGGVNLLKTVEERRDAIRMVQDEVIRSLTIDGYNPTLGKIITPVLTETDISGSTPFIRALRAARQTLHVGKHTKRDLEDVINGVEKPAMKLRLSSLPISMVTRKQIRLILNDCGNTAHKFNKFRTNLMILFSELFEMEATENDPLSKIKKRKTIKRCG